MLDKKCMKILTQLNKLCNNTYKVFEKPELQSLFSSSEESLQNTLSFLKEHQLIDIKYDDENVVCLCVTPKAIAEVEEKQDDTFYNKKIIKIMLFNCLFCAISSFVGAFLAMLIIK